MIFEMCSGVSNISCIQMRLRSSFLIVCLTKAFGEVNMLVCGIVFPSPSYLLAINIKTRYASRKFRETECSCGDFC